MFDALSRLEIYSLNPKEIWALQKPDPGELLRRDGSNIPSMLQSLDSSQLNRVNDHLSRIVKGLASAQTKSLASQETIEFRQAVKGQKHPWTFLASSMSDGTLRALGILKWLSKHMSCPYDPIRQQAELTKRFDLRIARSMPSFDRLIRRLTPN